MTRLERFAARFTYEPDRGLEAFHWRPLNEADPRGDCEDYALTAAWIMAPWVVKLALLGAAVWATWPA